MAKTRAKTAAIRSVSAQAASKSNSRDADHSAPTSTARDGKPLPTDLQYYSFADSAAFEKFMDAEHLTLPGFYLKTARKSSGVASIDLAEATVVALCFGWIDGWGKGIDDTWHLKRFTPRRPQSIWSQKNVSTVERLEREGRMRPSGIAAAEAAKADGRWERAYAGPANMTTPTDMQAALDGDATARAFFESLNRSQKYSVLWRVQTASPTARSARIHALLQQLSVGQVPGGPSNPGKKKDATTSKVKKIRTSKG